MGPINYAEDEDGKLLPLMICKEYYKKSIVKPSDQAYDIDSELETGERRLFLFFYYQVITPAVLSFKTLL